MSDPVLHVLAGPNGAGKSTFYVELLGPVTGLRFINADEIATWHWPGQEMEHAYAASDIAAAERSKAIGKHESFVTETVFSHPSKLELIEDAEQAGYRVTLHILIVPEELALARVKSRFERGGHDVPELKIRERFARLWGHLRVAIDSADETFVYDNSRAARPFRLIATFSSGHLLGKADWPSWAPDELRSGTIPQ